ncbi:Leukocyte-associated immunoglobulin-like receptor 1 [Tupaia chinensis]|nr:Leukocyte-associated immunoglobulin-like receptor 1 [Tupaia chinensis]
MPPHPAALLGLGLCLGWTVPVQDGALPRPSILAEPGSVIPRGQPVTIVCRGPAGAESFRLETEDRRSYFREGIIAQPGQPGTEARFPIEAKALVKLAPDPRPWAPRQVSHWDLGPARGGMCGVGKQLPSRGLEPAGRAGDVAVSPAPPVPSSREYKVLNCVRLGLAAVVLLVLAGILVDAQCGGAGPSEDAVTEAREPPPGGLARGGHSDGSEAPLRDPEPQ